MSDGLGIAITVQEDVTRALDFAARLGGDLTAPMAEISTYLVGETAERFRTERDPLDVPWKKSLRVTGYTDAKGKRVEGDGGQTLTLSADLRRSIKGEHGRDFAAVGPEASGGAAVYAGVHQFGATIRPKAAGALNTPFGPRAAVTIPKREYLGFTAADGEEVILILGEHVGRAFSGGVQA